MSMIIDLGSKNYRSKTKMSKICRAISRVQYFNRFPGYIRKSDTLKNREIKKRLANRDNSGFHLPLSRSYVYTNV